MDMLSLFTENFVSVPILFFILGVCAGFLKSDLDIPEQISSYFAIYLMMAIGFKGGLAIAKTDHFTTQTFFTMGLGVMSGFILPFIGYFFLKRTTKLDAPTAAAVAAHYGSVSLVTFVTCISFLENNLVTYAGYIVATLALMEAPAILSGLYIAHKAAPNTITSTERATPKLSKEIFVNGAILLLTGSFLVGWATGEDGLHKMQGFLIDPFDGILAFFLLDMGLVVARQLMHINVLNLRLLCFGIYMPLLSATIGLALSKVLGLSVGTATLFTVLLASASYIAVTAAMRLALPEAKAGVYVPLSLGVTFPFNIIIGIPLYYTIANIIL